MDIFVLNCVQMDVTTCKDHVEHVYVEQHAMTSLLNNVRMGKGLNKYKPLKEQLVSFGSNVARLNDSGKISKRDEVLFL